MEEIQQVNILTKVNFDKKKYLEAQKTKKNHTIPMPLLHTGRFLFKTIGYIAPHFSAKLALKLFLSPRITTSKRSLPAIVQSAKPLQIPHKNGELLQGYTWGNADAPTVLFAHGWETKGLVFRSFVQPLLEKGYQVATFDAPAHGQSQQKQTHVVDYGKAIETAIQQLGNVVALVGHSFGGDSSAFLMAHTSQNIRLKCLVLIGAPAKLKYVIERTADFLHLPDKVTAILKKLLSERLGKPIEEMSVSEIGDLVNQRVEKTLVVHDRYDAIVPFSDAEVIAKDWKGIHFLITEGYGHNHILRSEVVINNIVDFIK